MPDSGDSEYFGFVSGAAHLCRREGIAALRHIVGRGQRMTQPCVSYLQAATTRWVGNATPDHPKIFHGHRENSGRAIFFGICAVFGLAGCSELWPRLDIAQVGSNQSNASLGWYKARPPLGLKLHYNYSDPSSVDYFRSRYDAASDKQAERNSILFELMAIVDEDYSEYEKAVRTDRVYKDSLVAITSLALSGTATAMGGGAAATLAAIDTGIKGANAVVDKNAFSDQAPNILLNQMRTVRDNQATTIYKSMDSSVGDYSLDAGIRDISHYYRAGSVTAAVVALAAKTATESEKAKTDANDAKVVATKARP